MTPMSARLAPLSPRDQVVQPLALFPQFLDEVTTLRLVGVPFPTVAAVAHAHHHAVAAVTALAPRSAAHEQPPQSHHAHHHQGADQQQQQYRYPYRPFHLCAPFSARPILFPLSAFPFSSCPLPIR